ncbi:16S rRNA (adenine1518-N6/adenine1519-N6)-dimethyltransferase [Epilithonimonas bovis DSM 19482]|uniref:Ribosomal RNA small subunit methyltransferase A n=1 Tax=Epilithonimonas bovis DSM 19482 TaxID=1121284 RepID=A0A1U7PW14_9FLAO|nr:16S rRNA (adenine(1518)-N(6)/adenine(1519)-N(6))-dimethyltransferase RsmA [Epilithonimonas bovis]SIT96030.1 16S rRNA (adenine1518-N6/adenine1519-N6)-dimethyltransferase [Epilithonimonas bovis DSM 19482]
MDVRAKKHLGQHFLTDQNIAGKIVDSLSFEGYHKVLEVGPGMGVLTKFLLQKEAEIYVAEIDQESIVYLKEHYPKLEAQHFVGDFLKINIPEVFGEELAVIGNFPYNISSQILFKIIDNFQYIPEMSGMFQKEVAERTAAKPRTKDYGILSVLVQAYYDVEYLFTVHENVFNPPPKVKSGVIRMTRNLKPGLTGNEILFKQIVKAGFGQRRKKMSNSLKVLGIPEAIKSHAFLDIRAEELSVADFISFANEWKSSL